MITEKPYDRYMADWGHELGDRVAQCMWYENVSNTTELYVGELYVRDTARLAEILRLPV